MLHVSASLPTGSRRLWLAAVTLALAAVPFQLTARASSFLPAPLAQRHEMAVGSHPDVHGEMPRMWVVQLFGVVQDRWVEGRRAIGVPMHGVPAQSGVPLTGVRFGGRRTPSGGEVAPQRPRPAADGQSRDANGPTPGEDPQPDNAAPAIDNATDFQDYFREMQTTLRVLAEETGGFAIVNMNDALSRRLKELAAQRNDAAQAPLPEVVERAQAVTLEELQASVRESQARLRKLREVEALNNERLREQSEAATRQQQAELEALLRSLERAAQPRPEATRQYYVWLERLRQASEETPRTTETTEFVRQQLEERLRDLNARYLANHPDRLAAERMLEQFKAQSAQLDAAREALARQRVLLEEARARLMEAEKQMRDATQKALRQGGTPPSPDSQPPVK